MSMGVAPGRGGQPARRRGYRPLVDINMTPMIDVMLTILIIFMVSAPLLTIGVPVDLPEVAAGLVNPSDEPASVTVGADGKVFLQDKEVDVPTLLAQLGAIKKSNPKLGITFHGDKAANYGQIMQVLGALNEAGFSNISLLTEMPEKDK